MAFPARFVKTMFSIIPNCPSAPRTEALSAFFDNPAIVVSVPPTIALPPVLNVADFIWAAVASLVKVS